ncbi:MAG: bacillithiol biosynthesis cysteine-adding enzyme BshC [Acidobacteriota bacterium]
MIATVPASSSSAIGRLELDLQRDGRLPSIPRALLAGHDADLLAPLDPLRPGSLPARDAPAASSRAALARALTVANQSYGHPEAERLGAKLADPATRVVVTGQQPGLYGGPLLTLSKLLAAVRWAETIETTTGAPAMAVFWMATEDHDWREMARATVVGRDGVETLDLGDDPSPLLPIGMRTFGDGLRDARARLEAHYGGPRAEAGLALLDAAYRPDARFGEAFARLLIGLLGGRAPLLLDAMNTEVKRLQRPWLRRLVEDRHAVNDALQRAHARVEERGHPLQVTPQPGLSPLFLLRGTRRQRIAWVGDDFTHFQLRGDDAPPEPVEKLLETIDDNPAVVSPGVLARPAIQDALLGTTLQVLGPSELSYMAQAGGVYEALDLEGPSVTLRPQAMLLTAREVTQMADHDVDLETLWTQEPEAILAARQGGGAAIAENARGDVLARLDRLAEEAAALDPNLGGPLGKTRGQIEKAFAQFERKVVDAAARRHEVAHGRLQRLRDVVLPGGAPQERTLSLAHYLLRHGPGFVDALARLRLDPRRLQALELGGADA